MSSRKRAKRSKFNPPLKQPSQAEPAAAEEVQCNEPSEVKLASGNKRGKPVSSKSKTSGRNIRNGSSFHAPQQCVTTSGDGKQESESEPRVVQQRVANKGKKEGKVVEESMSSSSNILAVHECKDRTPSPEASMVFGDSGDGSKPDKDSNTAFDDSLAIVSTNSSVVVVGDCEYEFCTGGDSAMADGEDEGRRIHTVLSYCDGNTMFSQFGGVSQGSCEFQHAGGLDGSLAGSKEDENGNEMDVDLQVNVYDFPTANEDALLLEDDPMSELDEDDTQSSEEDTVPRRQFKIPRLRPCAYNFSILPKHMQKAAPSYKKTVNAAKQQKACRKIAQNLQKDSVSKKDGGETSVFDFHASQEVTKRKRGERESDSGRCNESRSKLDISYSTRTREEQLAVDREVLEAIARTRVEIRAIRVKYATLREGRAHKLQAPQQEQPHIKMSFTYGDLESKQYEIAEVGSMLYAGPRTGRRVSFAEVYQKEE